MDDMIGTTALSRRWGITPRGAQRWVRAWKDRPGPDVPVVIPDPRNGNYDTVLEPEVSRWEQRRKSLGLPIPGEKPRGPRGGGSAPETPRPSA